MRRNFSLMLVLVIISKFCFSQTATTISLNKNWQFKYKNKWYNTEVPNSIHTDLLNNKLIDDPFYRDNESKLQWIDSLDWEYKKEFEVDSSLLQRQVVELIFKGLDTYSVVYLNDSLILQADNMFREWNISCKPNLRFGKNYVKIIFHSASKKSKELYENYPYKKLPGEERVMVRKAQYHFGWDFAPRFVGCGLGWAELIGWDYFNIENVTFQTDSFNSNEAYLSGKININSLQESYLGIIVFNKADIFNFSKKNPDVVGNLIKGENEIPFQFTIKNPKLWWCNGSGDQNNYDLLVYTIDPNGHSDSIVTKVGIRTIELVQQPDSAGKSFYFKLNGRPIFIKGANYIPPDVFLNRVTDDKYESLLKDVKDANMNMLRVWGGGIYEKEKFYDLCDEYGILVWQDFMFACGMYPFDTTFLQNVKEEAEQQVKRLSNHPCIALWCGNNENSEGWHRWGWQDGFDSLQRKDIWNGYEKLFNDLLPTAVKKYSNTFYWETTPEFGRGDVRHSKEGDAHNWFVWHDGEPFENYEQKIPRFMSEFGFQSYPDMETIKIFTVASDRTVNSAVMKSHQKHSRGNAIIKTYMQREYGIVPDTSAAGFSEFVERSQQLQADGIGKGIKAHLKAKPYCMGTLFWQLNDCWPGISWSAIDYYGRKKKLYIEVQKLFGE
ncbi:MAG: glycoside hydrolase family 2 TIM barrel-domain containing protein [Bacteroidia bacterium]